MAQRKLDYVDWALQSSAKAKERGEEAKIDEYPPDVQDILKLFWRNIGIPIPSQKEVTRFARWIKDLRYLDGLVRGYDKDKIFAGVCDTIKTLNSNVTYPSGINSFVIAEIGKINREKQTDALPFNKVEEDENEFLSGNELETITKKVNKNGG